MRTTTFAVIAALLALASTLPTASADDPPRNIATITIGQALTITLPVMDGDIPTMELLTSSDHGVEYRETACRGPWTVGLVATSAQHSILTGSRIRITVPANAQPGSRRIRYRMAGAFTRTRLENGVVVSTTREACFTVLIDAQWTVRAPSRPSSVPRPEAHLSSTPYRSQPVSNPSCYVVVTVHARTNDDNVRRPDTVSMTACLTPLELYQNDFVDAVRDPTVPGAINRAINAYIAHRQCRSDEHLPDSPPGGAYEKNSCLQREGWTHHE